MRSGAQSDEGNVQPSPAAAPSMTVQMPKRNYHENYVIKHKNQYLLVDRPLEYTREPESAWAYGAWM
jgi:hypothetical protein